ncbi:hypothetical protein D3C87_1907490 [compost metagenome]
MMSNARVMEEPLFREFGLSVMGQRPEFRMRQFLRSAARMSNCAGFKGWRKLCLNLLQEPLITAG